MKKKRNFFQRWDHRIPGAFLKQIQKHIYSLLSIYFLTIISLLFIPLQLDTFSDFLSATDHHLSNDETQKLAQFIIETYALLLNISIS